MVHFISTLALSALTFLPSKYVAAKSTLRGLRHQNTDKSFGRSTENGDVPDPDIFEPAISLEDFKKVDPAQFEWVNPDEIKAGETTCGFLTAPLGWEVDEDEVTYPFVKVYVCVSFAKHQPAPRGNLAMHCGGPGSLSSCNYIGQIDMDKDITDSYNIIGFDQRGMGRSEPTFMVDECTVQMQEDASELDVNFGDEESIRAASKVYKQRSLDCWSYPDFQGEAIQEDGSVKKFHFLEYSGSRQLAEDIERVRLLFGDQKLSIYGISYGTVVMGTYATVFPSSVNLMILDGSVDPESDIVSRTMDDARSKQQRLDYFIASCEFGNSQCGVKDMRSCVNDINRLVTDMRDDVADYLDPFSDFLKMFGFGDYLMSKGFLMNLIIQLLFGAYDQAETICNIAAESDYDAFKDWVEDLLTSSDGAEEKIISLIEISSNNATDVANKYPMDTESKPTSGYSMSWPFENYYVYAMQTSVCQDMITAQDMAFGAYDEDRYVKFFRDLSEQYPGAGTQLPANNVAQWYSSTYYWPNNTPLPPMGNPFLTGIVAGQLWDPATPYIWTQKMRKHFKSATLLTSRSVNHSIQAARQTIAGDHACYANIERYLLNGVVDFTDGKVCESQHIGDSCTIDLIMSGQQCPEPHTLPPHETDDSIAVAM